MGVKNNFSQAVSELIGLSRTADSQNEVLEAEPKQTDVEDAEEWKEEGITDQENGETEMTLDEEGATMEKEALLDDQSKTPEQKQDVQPAAPVNPKEKILAMLAQQQNQQQSQPAQQTQPTAQQTWQSQQEQPKPAPGKTTVARGTVIIGEIKSEGDVELLGSVKGKVSSLGDILVNGKVVGDLIGKNIELTACAVQGNIVAAGLVTVDGDSMVIGDVKGENFCLDGKIKGNVIVEKEAKFQPKAILSGNVTTASIAMSQGAKIQGEVNIPLNEKETDLTFDVEISI